MDTATSLLAICAALSVGVVSPGPSFVMVARTAVAQSRRDGVAAAIGMGVGGVLFAAAALIGLHLVLTAVPWLHLVLKVSGGAWLLYLGWRIWRGAAQPLAVAATETPTAQAARRSFVLGFVTQVSNPKTALVYASVFAAFLPRDLSAGALWALPLLVFIIETGWYALVALALSSTTPRAAYLRAKCWLDRAAGGVLAALGLKLITSAHHV
jgi:threonine/homoserine/homoserine lactone efflux protein